MRILHTADWHVGKTLRGRRRDDEHRAVLAEITRIAQDGDFDLVLVAGDQFDSAIPGAQSEEIVYSALVRLARAGTRVVVIAGNHDNPRKLQAIKPLLALANVTVAPQVRRPGEGGVLTVATRNGPARIALFPFLSKRRIVSADALMNQDADDHQQSYQDRVTRVLAALCRDFADDAVNIVLGHLTVTGANAGGGERRVHIFDYYVPGNVFPVTAHYVALGHIHRGQRVPGPCPIHYAGAPLALDFGDQAHDPRVLAVEVQPKTPAKVEEIPLTCTRPMKTLQGTLAQLEQQRDEAGDAYLRLRLLDRPAPGLADTAREIFPNAVEIKVEPQGEGAAKPSVRPTAGDPGKYFRQYLEEDGVDPGDLVTLFDELLDELLGTDAGHATG